MEIKKDFLQKWFEKKPNSYFSKLAKSFNCDQNRITRKMLFTGYLKLLLATAIVGVLLSVINRLILSILGGTGASNSLIIIMYIHYILLGLIFIVCWIYIIKLHISRFHDLGYSGWLSIFCYITGLGLIFARFIKGEEKANKYGDVVTNITKDKNNVQ